MPSAVATIWSGIADATTPRHAPIDRPPTARSRRLASASLTKSGRGAIVFHGVGQDCSMAWRAALGGGVARTRRSCAPPGSGAVKSLRGAWSASCAKPGAPPPATAPRPSSIRGRAAAESLALDPRCVPGVRRPLRRRRRLPRRQRAGAREHRATAIRARGGQDLGLAAVVELARAARAGPRCAAIAVDIGERKRGPRDCSTSASCSTCSPGASSDGPSRSAGITLRSTPASARGLRGSRSTPGFPRRVCRASRIGTAGRAPSSLRPA